MLSRLFLSFCISVLSALILVSGIEAGDEPAQLTTNKAHDYHCKWSPDGKYIAFTSQRTGEPKIFIMPADGGDETLIETGLSGDHWFTWSPGSKGFVFDAYGHDGPPPRMWFTPVAGGKVRQLLPSVVPSFHPTISPDGEWVVFSCLRSGNADIWKAKLNGDSLLQLTTNNATDHHPQWTPDGKSIVFSSNRSGNWDIWIIDADCTHERQVTNASENDDQPCVSPDGKLIAFMSERGGKRDIWLKPITAGTAKRITDEGDNAWPSFSPDGGQLVWSSNRDGQSDLFIGTISDD